MKYTEINIPIFLETNDSSQKSEVITWIYKINGERMKRQKIMLPVAETGLQDYDYMTIICKNRVKNKFLRY